MEFKTKLIKYDNSQTKLFVSSKAIVGGKPFQNVSLQSNHIQVLLVEGERGERRAITETSQAQGGWQYHDDSLSRTHSHPLSRPWLLTKHKSLKRNIYLKII